jgi:DUF4097 and DUF4098 domain-containing protein YvlB
MTWQRLSIAGCLVALFAVGSAQATEKQRGRLSGETKSQTFPASANGTLILSSYEGEIRINVRQQNEVSISVDGIGTDDLDELEMRQDGKRIIVDYRPNNRRWASRTRFRVDLPADYNLDLKTGGGDIEIIGTLIGEIRGDTSGGDITLDDVEGEVDMNTSGGDIRTGKISGQGFLRTSGGDIRVQEGTDILDIHTSGGDITVGNAGNRIEARTSGGDITIADVAGEARIATSGGDIEVGRIASGARITTSGGDIQLRSASGEVRASTAGGDLELENVTGSVDARTAGGDIFVELTPSGSARSSMITQSGNIALHIDANAAVTIEAQIRTNGRSGRSRRRGYDRDDDREFEIRSDFSSAQFDEDESGDINAVYNLNGGGARITLETRDGNIDIRRLGRN